MGSKALIAGLFIVCAIGASVASSSIVPVAYGAGELTPGVGVTSIIGTLTALISGAGGLWSLFKSGTVADFAKGAIDNINRRDVTGTVLDAAFGTIAIAILSRKGQVDPTVLTKLGELRKLVDVEVKSPQKPE